jgi:hypothetical protein
MFSPQLEIVATVGKVGYSDIAIDDVYIDDGKCCKYLNNRKIYPE